jgi:hypothetical protein
MSGIAVPNGAKRAFDVAKVSGIDHGGTNRIIDQNV